MTIFFEEHEIYKRNFNKIDDEIYDVSLNCKDNSFHSLGFNYVCNVEFKDIRNEKNDK